MKNGLRNDILNTLNHKEVHHILISSPVCTNWIEQEDLEKFTVDDCSEKNGGDINIFVYYNGVEVLAINGTEEELKDQVSILRNEKEISVRYDINSNCMVDITLTLK